MNRTFKIAAAIFIGAIFFAAIKVHAKEKTPIASIKQARKIYVSRLSGDKVFASRLMGEMRKMGLQFVTEKSKADAIMTASGEYNDSEFYGQMKFFNARGKLIWKAQATRPQGSNYMAYSRLADQLRRALKD